MDCAREMRGSSSSAKVVTLRSRSAAVAAGSLPGDGEPDRDRPGLQLLRECGRDRAHVGEHVDLGEVDRADRRAGLLVVGVGMSGRLAGARLDRDGEPGGRVLRDRLGRDRHPALATRPGFAPGRDSHTTPSGRTVSTRKWSRGAGSREVGARPAGEHAHGRACEP